MSNLISLDKLPINKIGIITKLEVSSNIKRRLFDLGLIERTQITPLFKSPFGNPIAFEFRGSLIAMRAEDIKNILVTII